LWRRRRALRRRRIARYSGLLAQPLPMTALDRLKNAYMEALGVSPSSDFESFEYAETAGWDSVAHMRLVAGIEAAFDIMLTTEDVIDMSSFRKAREILGKYDVSFE
jgi:acyl carrier protein